MDFAAFRDKSIQTTDRFLHTESALGTTFADLAKRYKETGNTERDETSKRNAQAALDAMTSRGDYHLISERRSKHAVLSWLVGCVANFRGPRLTT
jgi:hypothetical protein